MTGTVFGGRSQTPGVLLLHGFRSDCGAMEFLRVGLMIWLGVEAERVQCFQYDSTNGVAIAASQLLEKEDHFRASIGLYSTDKVDYVAHSFGGLVARYLVEYLGPNGPAGTLQMLGTPNDGHKLADFMRDLCPGDDYPIIEGGVVCEIAQFVVDHVDGNTDLQAQDITDLSEGSEVLERINADPGEPGVTYRVRVGRNASRLGGLLYGGAPNDCFVDEALDRRSG